MRTKQWWLLVSALALLPACGGGTEVHYTDGAAKDTPAADRADAAALPETNSDRSPADAPAQDLALDLTAADGDRVDQAAPPDSGGVDLRAIVDVARRDVEGEAGKLDVAAADAAGEAGPPPSYACRDDSDCCIVTESCSATAYLYSKGPGASGMPTIPPPPSMCIPCMQPAVQVRCDQGQCVGTKVSGVSSGPLVKDHCGTIPQLDGGAVLFYQPAYAGAQQTSWGCS